MRRKGVGPLLFFVVLTVVSVVWTLLASYSPVLGLDLQGGVSVVLQPEGEVPDGETIDQSVEIIRNRVDALGVAEPDITRQGNTVLVQLPGVKDQDRALELVGQTAELRFRPVLQILEPCGAGVPSPGCPDAPATTTTAPGDATTTTAVGGATTTTAPTTTTVPPDGEEQGRGLQGLSPGESAAAQQPTTTLPPVTTAPTTTGPTPTTAPGGAATGPCAGEEDAARLGPDGLPRRLNDVGVTPRPRDEPCNTVLLPELADDDDCPAEQQLNGRCVVARYLAGPAALTGDALSTAAAALTPSGVEWEVRPTFRAGEEGIDQFNAIASACFAAGPTCPTTQLAIVLDTEVISAPRIQQPNFERDQITITGQFDEGSAKDLALVLRYGALPVTLVPQQVQTVSATLGEDSLEAGLISGIIGLVLTAAFMIGYYRLLGVVAIASLILEFGLVWVTIAVLGETRGLALTLAGVTGLIVSIGISVDSNVIFYENLKEDVQNGRTFRSTVERSFDTSFSTILKADFATLIGAVVLYYLSVGPVRGFALLLGISTVIDIFAGWFFIRPAVLILARNPRWRERTKVFGMPQVAEAPS